MFVPGNPQKASQNRVGRCLVAGAAQSHNHGTNINIYKYYLYVSNVSDQLGCVTSWQMREKHYDAIDLIYQTLHTFTITFDIHSKQQPTNHISKSQSALNSFWPPPHPINYFSIFRFSKICGKSEFSVVYVVMSHYLEICEGTEHERRGLDMGTWIGLLDFWRRMMKKLGATEA